MMIVTLSRRSTWPNPSWPTALHARTPTPQPVPLPHRLARRRDVVTGPPRKTRLDSPHPFLCPCQPRSSSVSPIIHVRQYEMSEASVRSVISHHPHLLVASGYMASERRILHGACRRRPGQGDAHLCFFLLLCMATQPRVGPHATPAMPPIRDRWRAT